MEYPSIMTQRKYDANEDGGLTFPKVKICSQSIHSRNKMALFYPAIDFKEKFLFKHTVIFDSSIRYDLIAVAFSKRVWWKLDVDIVKYINLNIMGFQLTWFCPISIKIENQFCSFLRNYSIERFHPDFDKKDNTLPT